MIQVTLRFMIILGIRSYSFTASSNSPLRKMIARGHFTFPTKLFNFLFSKTYLANSFNPTYFCSKTAQGLLSHSSWSSNLKSWWARGIIRILNVKRFGGIQREKFPNTFSLKNCLKTEPIFRTEHFYTIEYILKIP